MSEESFNEAIKRITAEAIEASLAVIEGTVREHFGTRADTPQSIPSEREEIVKWLRGPHPDKYPFARAWEFAAFGNHFADSVERGEHLTRQALEQGSGK